MTRLYCQAEAHISGEIKVGGRIAGRITVGANLPYSRRAPASDEWTNNGSVTAIVFVFFVSMVDYMMVQWHH